MKKLKLFQKTYLFTMALMGVMIIISHTLLYMLLPTFYINKKHKLFLSCLINVFTIFNSTYFLLVNYDYTVKRKNVNH